MLAKGRKAIDGASDCFKRHELLQKSLKMLGLDNKKRKQQNSNKKNHSQSPVLTADDWFDREGLSVWPIPVASEGELDISVIGNGIESKDQLLGDLKKHASFDVNVLDELCKQVNRLEHSLNKYANHLLEFKEETDDNEIVQEKPEVLCETTDGKSLNSWQKNKSEVFIGSKNRTLEHTAFPGFHSSELTPLPGSLEAPQLLNRITNIQHFRGSFKKLWKQYFLSDATVAIFQDTFWWWFLDKYHFDEKSQAHLFNRLADSFVGLFLSISMTEKDLFFKKFADCLAQGIYAAFCETFPMSFKSFNDDFRNDLLNTLSEWITGVRPPPDSWKSWDLELLENDQIRSLQDDRTQQLKSSLSFDQDTFLDFELPDQNADRQVTFLHTSQPRIKKCFKESHQAGPGPEFQRVTFNLHGKSPLIAHFLAANRIQVEEPSAIKKLVTRTEVDKYPAPFPTYHELIMDRKKEAKLASRKYTALMRRSLEERQQTNSTWHNPIQSALRIDHEDTSERTESPLIDDEFENMTLKSYTETEAAGTVEEIYYDGIEEDF